MLGRYAARRSNCRRASGSGECKFHRAIPWHFLMRRVLNDCGGFVLRNCASEYLQNLSCKGAVCPSTRYWYSACIRSFCLSLLSSLLFFFGIVDSNLTRDSRARDVMMVLVLRTFLRPPSAHALSSLHQASHAFSAIGPTFSSKDGISTILPLNSLHFLTSFTLRESRDA